MIQVEEPLWVEEKRKKARDEFERLAWPNFRYGLSIRSDYSDLNVDAIVFDGVQEVIIPRHDEIVVMSLRDALVEHEDKVKPYLMEFFNNDHKFGALHRANWTHGLFIYVPPHLDSEEPLVIKRKCTGNVIHHNLIVVGEGARVSIIEEIKGNATICSNATEVIVKQSGVCRFTSLQDYADVFQFDYKNAHVEQDAQMYWHDIVLGSIFTHSTTESVLIGTGADTTIKHLFFGNKQQRLDVGAHAIHANSHTTSDIVAKGVLNGKAKSIYRGLVKIEQNAPSSNGYQKEDVLMLSEEAESDSIPQLEIDNNEVKCSHAATTSHVDDEKLFYLMARGIGRKEATKLYVQGFLEPFMKDVVHGDGVRERIEGKL